MARLSRRGIEEAALDAGLLLAEVLSTDRAGLVLRAREHVPEDELLRFSRLVRRRRAYEPVAYILGRKEFFGLEFAVGPGALVPRPDTETLVEAAGAFLDARGGGRALDAGTGTGCIAIALAHSRPSVGVIAADVEPGARAWASRNVERHELRDRVTVVGCDISALSRTFQAASFDVLVSNPPYVEDEDPALDLLPHEPRRALVSQDGEFPRIYERLVEAAERLLRPGGALIVEVGAGQAERIAALMTASPMLEAVRLERDLGGIDRVVRAIRRETV